MAIKTPLDPAKVKNHFVYGYWKYLLLIVVAIAGWNLIYSSTEYRPPDEKRIDFYVSSNTVDTDALKVWLEETRVQAFLGEYVDNGAIDATGIDLANGYVTVTDTGERYLMGIPADSLYGLLTRFGIDCRNMVFGIMVRSGNQEDTVKFIDYLITNLQEPAPEWLATPAPQP